MDNNNEKQKKHQTSRPLGDTKIIKMKVLPETVSLAL